MERNDRLSCTYISTAANCTSFRSYQNVFEVQTYTVIQMWHFFDMFIRSIKWRAKSNQSKVLYFIALSSRGHGVTVGAWNTAKTGERNPCSLSGVACVKPVRGEEVRLVVDELIMDCCKFFDTVQCTTNAFSQN